jgi:putative ABC transport system ATP-binding protein
VIQLQNPRNLQMADVSSLNRDGFVYPVEGLVLPDGVDELVCDQFVRELARHELCAVVFENRLLILPVSGELLDPAYQRVVPHKSVWESLGIRRATPNFVPPEGQDDHTQLDYSAHSGLPDVIDLTTNDSLSRDASTGASTVDSTGVDSSAIEVTSRSAGRLIERLAGGDTIIDLTTENETDGFTDIVEDEPAPVVSRDVSTRLQYAEHVASARPLRSGQRLQAPAVELSEVRMALTPLAAVGDLAKPQLTAMSQSVLRVSLQIPTGQTVAIVGARKRAARMLMSLIVGLEEPETGLVFHQGVPIGLPSLDGERWNLAMPGVLPRQMPVSTQQSVIDYVGFPMQLFGVFQHVSHRWARSALDELGAISLAEQPFDSLKGPDRRLVALARALVGPWPARFLFDPLYGFDEGTAANARRTIERYSDANATLVMLTDDPELLRLADRVLGVSDGQVYEAVRRE